MQRSLEKDLENWKNKADRKPLILRGARRVGKTYLVEKFGKEHFPSLVTVNFEEMQGAHLVFSKDLTPALIIRDLAVWLGKPITPGKTLLFLDEIQACPQALLSLRFFKEQMSELHIIAAGSLLEFALKEEKFSFPVGRVEYLYLRPLSFLEFLRARRGEQALAWILEASIQSPIGPAAHDRLLQTVREYFIVGGMPEAVSSFLRTGDFLSLDPIHKHLLLTYDNDLNKYPKHSQQKFMRKLFSAVPRLICGHFKYAKIDAYAQSRDYMEALEVLSEVGLIHRVFATSASRAPLELEKKEKKFKLLFLDIGLLPHPRGEILDIKQLSTAYRGDLAEQFVGQELVAYERPYSKAELFYWERKKRGSEAEVDYVLEDGSCLIPIEVKAGPGGRLKSLQQFLIEKETAIGVQISEVPLSLQGNILSVPFYMIAQIPRIIKCL
ncbi:MAG: ATP-binding protein [Chlamydiae bacterium]|nr:ATP-binding protein [Chlamydiota bacterium]